MHAIPCWIVLVQSISVVPPGVPDDATASPHLEFTLAKQTVVEGEPLVITFILRNPHDQPVWLTVGSAEWFANGDFWLTIKDTSGKEVAFWYQLGGDTVGGVYQLPSGSTISCSKFALPSKKLPKNQFELLPPGEYTCTASFLRYGQKIHSEPRTIRVAPAEGIDKDALALVKQIPPMWWTRRISKIEPPTKLVRDYPECTYAAYVEYRLAIDPIWHLHESSGRASDKRERDTATASIGRCDAFLSRYPQFPLRTDVEIARALGERLLGNIESSRGRLTTLRSATSANDATGSLARRLLGNPVRLPVFNPDDQTGTGASATSTSPSP